MAAPLAVCTKEEQRTGIRLLWLEGVSGAEIRRRLSTQYGDSALPRRSLYDWIETFKSGQTRNFRGKGDANHFLRLKRTYTGRLAGKRVYDQVICWSTI
jgi:hypothetical protein